MRNIILLTVTFGALVGCVEDDIPSNPTPTFLNVSQMPAYCRGEASARYGGRPQDIITLPAEQDQGMYSVYGNTEDEEDFFICTFTGEGEFVGLDAA